MKLLFWFINRVVLSGVSIWSINFNKFIDQIYWPPWSINERPDWRKWQIKPHSGVFCWWFLNAGIQHCLPMLFQCADSTQWHRQDLRLWYESRMVRQEHPNVIRRHRRMDGSRSHTQWTLLRESRCLVSFVTSAHFSKLDFSAYFDVNFALHRQARLVNSSRCKNTLDKLVPGHRWRFCCLFVCCYF